MHSRSILAACVAAASLLAAAPAGAQTSTVAEALYRDAQQLLADGQVHAACMKFQESQHLDPGIGTLINLGSCHEKEGKTASAWSEFTEASAQAARAGQHDREQFAQTRIASLEKHLHRLVIEVLTPAPGMLVKLDGVPFGVSGLGTAIPLDPGDHLVEVSATGRKPWSQHVNLGPGAVTERIEVPALDAEGAPAVVAAPVTGAGPRASVAPAADAPAPSSGRRTGGAVLASVGGAGIVAGVVLVVRSVLYKSQANDETTKAATATNPVDRTNLTAASKSDQSAGSTNQVAGIVGAVAGAAALGVGVYLAVSDHGAPSTSSTGRAPRRSSGIARATIVPLLPGHGGGAGVNLAW